MILGQTQAFASPGEALEHHGVKGMRWGVRKKEETTSRPQATVETPFTRFSSTKAEKVSAAGSPPRTKEEKAAARRAMAKKAAIGAGVLTAVAGAGFIAYKLNQSGKLPLSSIRMDPKQQAAAKKVIHEQRDVIMLTRGKYKAGTFLKQGDTPNFFTHWEDAFVKEVGDADTADVFQKLSSGKIAAAFKDPEDRKDFSGRPISHQVIIPTSMVEGIDSIDDVKTKIWPKLKDTYDEFYAQSLDPNQGF